MDQDTRLTIILVNTYIIIYISLNDVDPSGQKMTRILHSSYGTKGVGFYTKVEVKSTGGVLSFTYVLFLMYILKVCIDGKIRQTARTFL